jgi:hypothetical protein
MERDMAYVKLLKAETRYVRHVYFIDSAVGQGRANKRDDVLLIQFFLKALSSRADTESGESYQPPGQTQIQVDGICGANTVAFIRHFQGVVDRASKAPQLRPWQDGVVDVVPEGGMFGAVHGSVYTMISLNIAYSSLYGKDAHAKLFGDPLLPRELATIFFI